MENKISNKLIVFGIIIFSLFFAGSASAYYNAYDSSYWLRPAGQNMNDGYYQTNGYYVNSNNYNPIPETRTSVVNNYYYQTVPGGDYYYTVPASTSKTKTINTEKVATNDSATSVNNNSIDNIDRMNYNNNLGASAYNAGNGITALSLRGSGGFMPTTIWGWILVVILILVIIIIARMFVHKPSPADHDAHH
jgi:hypothetical protein